MVGLGKSLVGGRYLVLAATAGEPGEKLYGNLPDHSRVPEELMTRAVAAKKLTEAGVTADFDVGRGGEYTARVSLRTKQLKRKLKFENRNSRTKSTARNGCATGGGGRHDGVCEDG